MDKVNIQTLENFPHINEHRICPDKIYIKFMRNLMSDFNYDFRLWLGLVWFVGFNGISTLVGYLTPNPFLCK